MLLPFHQEEAFYEHGIFLMGRWCGNRFFRDQSTLSHSCLCRLVDNLLDIFEAFNETLLYYLVQSPSLSPVSAVFSDS